MTKIKIVDRLASIKSYSGVKPLEAIAEELQIPTSNIIKLDGNENPYEPLPEVLNALSSLKRINFYPDPLCSILIQSIAIKENLIANNIIVGSGSDELIELLIKAYANPYDSILSVSPTFGMISFLSQVYGIKHVTVPMQLVKDESFARYILDEAKFLDAAKHAKIVFIARPNNPDGTVLSEKFVESLVSLPILLIVDEAYIEFSNYQSLANWIPQYDNIVVLRTFSKAYGLGGLRVGYGIIPNDIRKVLVSIKQPYNVNIAGQKAAIAALSSHLVEKRIIEIKKTREWFINQLKLIQNQNKAFWIHRSEACYILLTFETPEVAKSLYEYLYSKGILVRYYSSQDMVNNLRISIGLQENMEKVIDKIKLFFKGGN
ncbi:MAG: histidinol-phosphate transaminase [Candidatus Lokiarchaeota archaeon]|nr:histidinol-phosphate transaminase [Candidatus Lokiarchaeota archaeon]